MGTNRRLGVGKWCPSDWGLAMFGIIEPGTVRRTIVGGKHKTLRLAGSVIIRKPATYFFALVRARASSYE